MLQGKGRTAGVVATSEHTVGAAQRFKLSSSALAGKGLQPDVRLSKPNGGFWPTAADDKGPNPTRSRPCSF